MATAGLLFDAPDQELLLAKAVTLTLDNQKIQFVATVALRRATSHSTPEALLCQPIFGRRARPSLTHLQNPIGRSTPNQP